MNYIITTDSPTQNTGSHQEDLALQAKRLIEAPNVFELFTRDFRDRGFAGDKHHAQLLYAVATSRLLKDPMCLFIKGAPSSGKSYLFNEGLAYFPEDSKEVKSGMSPKAIAYGKSDLKHRILGVQEMSGLNGREGNFLIRTLITEKRINWEVTEKKGDSYTTRSITREGPIAFILTTTLATTHREDESRALSIEINDTVDHTKTVIEEMADQHAGGKTSVPRSLDEYHSFQQWLALGPRDVLVPFARQLGAHFYSRANRAKRDFGQLIATIKVSALLHQANRATDEEGRVVATLDDYKMVREFLTVAINEATGATISPETRETIQAILSLGGNGIGKSDLTGIRGPTLAALHEKMNHIDDTSLSRRVKKARKLGYVTDLTKGNGHPSNFIVVQALPTDRDVLPTVEELTEEVPTQQAA